MSLRLKRAREEFEAAYMEDFTYADAGDLSQYLRALEDIEKGVKLKPQ